MANVIIILGIIFLIIGCVYAIYCFINEMGLYMTIFFSVFCLVIGGILIKDGIDRKNAKEQEQMRNEIVDIDERTVVLSSTSFIQALASSNKFFHASDLGTQTFLVMYEIIIGVIKPEITCVPPVLGSVRRGNSKNLEPIEHIVFLFSYV